MRNALAIISLASIAGVAFQIVSAQESDSNSMSFFVTSENIGDGANLGGLAGADAHCQSLAEAVGAGGRTWRAYMSSSTEDARDRIGAGPWYNVKGDLIATDIDDLHQNNDNVTVDKAYHEKGGKHPGIAKEDEAIHDMLTGSGADGRLVLVQEGKAGIAEHETGDPATCNDWTGGEGRARVGHFDSQGGEPGTVWNSAHYTLGCSQEDLEKNASIGLFYCFAAD
jgi:hypothetical protein